MIPFKKVSFGRSGAIFGVSCSCVGVPCARSLSGVDDAVR